jgi:hypothetical protein
MYKAVIDTADVFSVCLYNFDINGSAVKEGHGGVLSYRVCNWLENGCTATVLGLASTTGDRAWNLELSRRRANAVTTRIVQGMAYRTHNPFAPSSSVRSSAVLDLDTARRLDAGIRTVSWEGKDLALHWGARDSQENPLWRAVWVKVWDRTAPPTDRDVMVDMKLPELTDFLLPQIGQGLDITSWIISLTLGDMLPVVDMAVSIIDTLAALPVAYASGDQLAYQNGQILGFNNAMQDMANAYLNRALDKADESTWPPIPRPRPHDANWTAQPTAFQDKWHEGEKDGCDKAYAQVQKMDRSPKPVTLTGRNGERIRRRLTGKFYLRWLAAKYGDGAAGFLMSQWNDYLNSQGKTKWPLH